MSRGVRAGFTLIELMIVIALLGIVILKVTMVMNSTSRTHEIETRVTALEDQAYRVLDQIAYAVMGCDRSTLFPDPEAPFLHSHELAYRVSLGVEDGEVVWSDPEAVGLGDGADGISQLSWRTNPGVADERRVVWCNVVRPFLEGELPNGVDDNGNGLIDERGLTFQLQGDSVRIQLTLERQDADGQRHLKSVETSVTCRN